MLLFFVSWICITCMEFSAIMDLINYIWSDSVSNSMSYIVYMYWSQIPFPRVFLFFLQVLHFQVFQFCWFKSLVMLRNKHYCFKSYGVSTMVVKITFWLVKLYDFISQNILYMLNHLKKSKMDEIRLKLSEIVYWVKSQKITSSGPMERFHQNA